MLHSSKAKEIATIKLIEDQIRDAALNGKLQISFTELSNDAKAILIDNGYDVIIDTKWDVTTYTVSWDK